MSDTYFTILTPTEATVTEKRSKFIAFAYSVSSVDEAMQHVSDISKRYFDARHVCWAYMLGCEREIFRANDNGEPPGTAGKPILGQINSLGLTDVVVIVVRYFGGIKLGTPGLITAYRSAARSVLEAAGCVELHVMSEISITFPYSAMNEVMKLTKTNDVSMLSSVFDNTCSMTLETRKDYEQTLKNRLLDIDGVCVKE